MKYAVVITGASRGFGRATAVAFAALLGARSDVDLFLWARDEAKLRDTERNVRDIVTKLAIGNAVQTFVKAVDLAKQESYVPSIDELVAKIEAQSPAYDAVYVIHNAASLGQLDITKNLRSPDELSAYWSLNLNSVLWFNKRLLEVLGATKTKLSLINLSSGAATSPIPSWGLYCTGKAARDMHFRVVASEQPKTDATVRTLKYSPGVLDTDMQAEIRGSDGTPDETRKIFVDLKEKGQLSRAEDSALYCTQVVLQDAFESGSSLRFDATKLEPRADIFP